MSCGKNCKCNKSCKTAKPNKPKKNSKVKDLIRVKEKGLIEYCEYDIDIPDHLVAKLAQQARETLPDIDLAGFFIQQELIRLAKEMKDPCKTF